MSRSVVMRQRVFVPVVAAWLTAVVVGLGALTEHSFDGGEQASAPVRWPIATSVPLTSPGHTLVVVAHPLCGCTRATMSELAWIMTRVPDDVRAYVLLTVPSGLPGDWRDGEIFRRASAIAGVTVVSDPDGVEAERFGAATSGQVYLFDAAGELQFEGGITPSRAHEGDNIGRQRILAIVDGSATDREHSAVYGCGLWDRAAQRFWLPRWRPAALALGDDEPEGRRHGTDR